MNLDELRTVQSKERSKDSLQHLRESFYADVARYIEELKDQRERAAERSDDPFDDPEVNRLTDEVHTAEDVVEAVYERRVGKVVKRASLAAAGMPADDEGLTNEERELFSELVERIEENKAEVLDILSGEVTPSAADSATADSAPAGASDAATPDASPAGSEGADPTADPGDAPTPSEDVSPADVMGGDSSPDASADAAAPNADARTPPPEADEVTAVAGDANEADAESDADESEDPTEGLEERTTIRITRDVGEIFGVDERTYELANEDVVTLPEENAGPLVERGAAEKLD